METWLIARRKKGQLLGARHDQQPVADHAAEALQQPLALGRFAVEQRDLFGIFAHPDEVEAEVGFVTLLQEIERRSAASRPGG